MFLPLGLDGQAWAYQVGRFFLKVRDGVPSLASVLLSQYLRDRGPERIVAPIRPLDGAPWISPTGPLVVRYWRSVEQLEAFAKDPELAHQPRWKAFNKQVGEVLPLSAATRHAKDRRTANAG